LQTKARAWGIPNPLGKCASVEYPKSCRLGHCETVTVLSDVVGGMRRGHAVMVLSVSDAVGGVRCGSRQSGGVQCVNFAGCPVVLLLRREGSL
jgi:hypothetical protein